MEEKIPKGFPRGYREKIPKPFPRGYRNTYPRVPFAVKDTYRGYTSFSELIPGLSLPVVAPPPEPPTINRSNYPSITHSQLHPNPSPPVTQPEFAPQRFDPEKKKRAKARLNRMSSTKRITKELEECMASPVADMTIALVSESDLYKWAVTMPGPPGTCYAGGTFNLTITLPREYPFQPPKLNFATRIYHPNVTDDSLGNVCLGMLKPETWKPAGRIKAVLVAVRQLLVEPNPDDPLENGIAELFRSNRPEFEKNAKSYVQRYAGGKP